MGYETDLKLFIDGVWKSADAGHTVVNPVDAQPIADVPFATKADLEEALAASERAWPGWRAMDVEKRAAILHKAAALLRERADHIARVMTQEQGKPLAESRSEVLGSAQLFDWYAEDAKRDYGRTLVRPAGQLSRVIRQPVGPVATFTPWNFRSICSPRRSALRSLRAAPSFRGRRRRPLAPRPSCSGRSPTRVSPRALPSSSTATPT